MKIVLISLILAAVASLLLFCKHQPKFTADTLPPQQLRWGSGGGFVGKETSYILLDNGQIFKRDMGGALTETAGTKSKTAKALFKSVQALDFSRFESEHPGNIYSFLERQDGPAARRAVWGDPKYPVDESLKSLYDRLNGLLKK